MAAFDEAVCTEDPTPDQDLQTICKKFTSLLRKLTPQNFTDVVGQCRELHIKTEDQLDAICKILHEKAISEPNSCVVYANMSKAIGGLKVPKKINPKEATNARAILLTYCQKEFESTNLCDRMIDAKKVEVDSAHEEKKALMREELMQTLRCRSTGNIRFICELFKLKMLTENIMHDCIYKLMKEETEEVNLECLCVLLKTVGADLDNEKAKARMNQYFATIQKIIDSNCTNRRIRYMLRDIVDLRKEKWVPRHPDSVPKNMSPPFRGGRGSKSSSSHLREEGWSTVGSGGDLSQGSRGDKALTSQEGERPIIASTRSIAGGRKTPPSQGASSRLREERRDAAQPQRPADPLMSRETSMSRQTMENRSKAILDKYLEAFDLVAELQGQPEIHAFVAYCINSALERQTEARNRTGELLQNLFANNLISMDSLLRGLREVLEYAEDLAVDIPKVYEYLAELLSPIIVLDNDEQRKAAVLGEIGKAIAEELKNCGKAKVLMFLILRDLLQKMPHNEVKNLWNHSRLSWTLFMQPGESVEEFLHSKGLEFMLSDTPASPAPTQSVSPAWVEENLSALLAQPDTKNEEIFSWIEKNIPVQFLRRPEFIRPLMTTVCRAAIHYDKVQIEVLNKRQPLLRTYFHNECELQALFALQALVHSIRHPPGVLREFFDFLYDEDLVSEDGFMQWMRNNDPQEQEGKGVALKQVVQFFAWIQEAQDDSTPKS